MSKKSKKNKDDMMLTWSSTSKALTHGTPVAENIQWCVACGYTCEGDYGYFVVQERLEKGAYHYESQVAFFKKTDEQAYQQAVQRLGQIK